MSGKDAESLMQWVHKATSLGLAHVVMPTSAGITPTKVEELQALHGTDNSEFVAIVLRVAKGVTDTTSAEEKLLELEVPYHSEAGSCASLGPEQSLMLTNFWLH